MCRRTVTVSLICYNSGDINGVPKDRALAMLGTSRWPEKAGVTPTFSASRSWVRPRSFRQQAIFNPI